MSSKTITSHVPFSRLAAGFCGLRNFHFHAEGAAAAPPPDAFKALREEYSRVHGEATAVVELAAKENRELTAAEKTANDGRFSRLEQVKRLLDERKKFADLAIGSELSGEAPPKGAGTVTGATPPPGRAEFDASKGGDRQTDPAKIDRAEFGRAMARWCATGDMDKKFATITTATASGALLPRTIAEPLVPTAANTLREAMALTGMKPIVTTTTADMTLPVMDASAGGQVAENASSETANDPSLAESIRLPMATYQSGTAYFSNLQLEANDFDLVSYIQTDLSYAKELGFESTIIAAMIADAGITQSVATATTTGFTYANLVDLNNKLPKRYQRQQVILLSAAAYAAAEKLTGDDGHPVLIKDPQDGRLLRFNGTPVLRCDYLEALTANKCVGLVISMLGFRIRDKAQETVQRYNQVPAKPNQTGFNLFSYHGYGYAPSAVAKLKTPAS